MNQTTTNHATKFTTSRLTVAEADALLAKLDTAKANGALTPLAQITANRDLQKA